MAKSGDARRVAIWIGLYSEVGRFVRTADLGRAMPEPFGIGTLSPVSSALKSGSFQGYFDRPGAGPKPADSDPTETFVHTQS